MRTVVIVGASTAGLSAAQTLRAHGYDGSVVMIGAEAERPYERPPLSKQYLMEGERSELALRSPAEYDELSLEWRLGRPAESLDPDRRVVALVGGEQIHYDGLILACGTRPRRLPITDELPNARTLRTFEDAEFLRARLRDGGRLIVLGAGLIGGEVAASARVLGCEVTLVDVTSDPFAAAVGPALGAELLRAHERHGVRLWCPSEVVSARARKDGAELTLSDGTRLRGEVVLVAIGVTPETDWLIGSGIALDDGIVCDECCRTSLPDVVAAGDVACWPQPGGGLGRPEHWINAVEMGAAAAGSLLDHAAPAYRPIPYFWTVQYDRRVQVLGRLSSDRVLHVVERDDASERVLGVFADAERVTGVAALRWPSRLAGWRSPLLAGMSLDDAREQSGRAAAVAVSRPATAG